jgi:flagellar basal body-associated protein FliL
MANKETMDVIEKTLDVVEEQIETLERIPKVHLNGTTKKQQIVILATVAVVSAAAGAGVAYWLTKRRLKAKYVEMADKEIAEAKNFYSALNHKPSPVELAKDYVTDKVTDGDVTEAVTAIRKYQGKQETADEVVEVEVVEVETTRNVFDDASSEEFDYEEELKHRTITAPYVITYEEFVENDKEYNQTSLTYFEGDDVLVDEGDGPINDTEMVVGNENLRRFGHGSHDKNVVYVQNDLIEAAYEVTRSEGSYVREVLGFIEHSHRPGSGKERKFRDDDG